MRPFQITLTASLFLMTGCFGSLTEPVPPAIEQPLFCDTMTEPFRYRQEEIDLRTEAGFTANLAREYRLNLSYDRECVTRTPQ
jgi:hypothetical protein